MVLFTCMTLPFHNRVQKMLSCLLLLIVVKYHRKTYYEHKHTSLILTWRPSDREMEQSAYRAIYLGSWLTTTVPITLVKILHRCCLTVNLRQVHWMILQTAKPKVLPQSQTSTVAVYGQPVSSSRQFWEMCQIYYSFYVMCHREHIKKLGWKES